jgi:uncharacterized protein (TIGR02391 family)
MSTARLIPPWPAEIIQGVADVLGATDTGFTGSEIGYLMDAVKAPDPSPAATKRHRLFNGLAEKQNRTQGANSTVAFITKAMAPVSYRNDPQLFTRRQQDLNEVLVHIGLRVTDTGQVARGAAAATLDEAAERAGSIRTELRRRGIHAYAMRYCTDEILAKNNFHALLEAAKSIPDRIRLLTGFTSDGSTLLDEAMGLSSTPKLRINALADDSDASEHKGFANLIRGLLGLYRNTTARTPRIRRVVSDDELLEALTTISMIHRRAQRRDRRSVGVEPEGRPIGPRCRATRSRPLL